MLPRDVRARAAQPRWRAQFGEDFAAARADGSSRAAGRGRSESGYGLHVVLVRRAPGRAPARARRGPAARRARARGRRGEDGSSTRCTSSCSRSTRRDREPPPMRHAAADVADAGDQRSRGDAWPSLVALAHRRRALASTSLVGARDAARLPRAARDGTRAPTASCGKARAGGEVEIYIAPVVPKAAASRRPTDRSSTPGASSCAGRSPARAASRARRSRSTGLESTVTDVLVRVHHADGRLESHLLQPATPSVTLGAATTRLASAPSAYAPARRRAHPARRRPPAVRARPAPDRRRPLDAA